MATKKSKKATMPKVDFVVDLTNATSAADVYTAFAYAKIDKCLDRNEYTALVNDIVDTYGIKFNICKCKCPYNMDNKKKEKKPNIFKRFWNWITCKK